jgi:hypothetical protein
MPRTAKSSDLLVALACHRPTKGTRCRRRRLKRKELPKCPLLSCASAQKQGRGRVDEASGWRRWLAARAKRVSSPSGVGSWACTGWAAQKATAAKSSKFPSARSFCFIPFTSPGLVNTGIPYRGFNASAHPLTGFATAGVGLAVCKNRGGGIDLPAQAGWCVD